MTKYYYLICSFSEITLKEKPFLTFEELINLFKINLTEKDFEKFVNLRKYIDIKNLRLLWENKEIDYHGNLNEAFLEDILLVKNFFPDFVFDFLDRYENESDRLKYFSFLEVNFLNYAIKNFQGFLRFYFKLEREIRLVLTALRAKKLKRDFLKEFQFEDFTDDLVQYIIAQKDLETFETYKKHEKIKNIYLKNLENPRKMYMDLLKYKFEKIKKYLDENSFSIDQVLSYATLQMLVEDLYKLNFDEGKQIVENL